MPHNEPKKKTRPITQAEREAFKRATSPKSALLDKLNRIPKGLPQLIRQEVSARQRGFKSSGRMIEAELQFKRATERKKSKKK